MSEHVSGRRTSDDPHVAGAAALLRRELPTPQRMPPWQPRPRSGRHRWPLVVAAASAALATAVVLTRLRAPEQPPSLTFELVAGARLSESDSTIVAASDGALLRFSDGSTTTLAAGTRGRVRALQAHGARVAVDAGRADFAIVHAPSTSWVVDVGPYTVRVVGTRFSAEWQPDTGVFDLRMKAGSVEVVGPSIVGTKVVSGTDRLRIRVGNGPQNAPPLEPAAPPPARPRPAPAKPAPLALAARTAVGDYAGAVEAAERQGVDRVVATASVRELVALADAARYTNRVPLAVSALEAVRRRWPRSRDAAEAAFALGRVAEDLQRDPQSAKRWYERYRGEAPGGRYAAESLGRMLVAVRATGGSAAARPIAQDYLAAYPTGSYAGVARQILAAP